MYRLATSFWVSIRTLSPLGLSVAPDNGKMRLLGIPTVADGLVQQAINQVLTLIYEKLFSDSSCGFSPRRGCHDAQRGAQSVIDDGCMYVVDLDLERFFDTVCTAASLRPAAVAASFPLQAKSCRLKPSATSSIPSEFN